MSAKYILLLIVIFIIYEVNCKCLNGQNETICWSVRCANIESCPKDKVLVEADPTNCNCCRRCETFKKPSCSDTYESKRCSADQRPESCQAADCGPVDKCERGQHFVKADYSKCICCDHCADDCISY